ncbi:MAG: hypothetical protein GY866_42610 [Proteobacteria bacterium]|nr:hypothetical protein [Pseudomonadota bacterium]
MTPTQLYKDFVQAFNSRKFVAGLLIAMIDFIVELKVPTNSVSSFEELLAEYPRQDTTAQGRRANTLIVRRNDTTMSLRPFYNEAERLFRAEHHRFDYPSCAPHATQAWSDYISWFDTLCGMNDKKLSNLRKKVIDFVLKELPDQGFQPESLRTSPPLFRIILEEFTFTAPPREPSGAALQGAVFGFIRADNPHLQVEIDKVRTGSKRLQRVGDVDAWDGERLAISAEVKNMDVKLKLLQDISGFANEVVKREAIGLLIAQSFHPKVKTAAAGLGLRALDLDDLIRIVGLWDPAKQKIAAESMLYYAAHVEKNSVLINRLRLFIGKIESSTNES